MVSPLRVLFLTPFHFGSTQLDDEFDTLVTKLLPGTKEYVLDADHLGYFESDDADYDTAQRTAILDAVRRANNDSYDAVVVACHYDPAVAEAREISRVPVIGPLQLTTGLTTQFGPRYAVVTDIQEAAPVIQQLIDGFGNGAGCVGVTALGWDGDAIMQDTLGAARAVDALVAELADNKEVQSVVIACTIVSAAYELHRDKFPDRGITVLNSNAITVLGAAALAAH